LRRLPLLPKALGIVFPYQGRSTLFWARDDSFFFQPAVTDGWPGTEHILARSFFKAEQKMSNSFMARAIQLSIESVNSGGGPFGAVVVKNVEIIAEGFNQVTPTNIRRASLVRCAWERSIGRGWTDLFCEYR
jgi:hypothetical protein